MSDDLMKRLLQPTGLNAFTREPVQNKLNVAMTIEDLTVIGIDGIRRSFDEHYNTMMEVEEDPTGAYHSIQNQHARIEELEKQNASLEAKLAKAVEALRLAEELYQLGLIDAPDWLPTRVVMARAAVLAELKGQDNE